MPNEQEKSLIDVLNGFIEKAEVSINKGNIQRGNLRVLTNGVRGQIHKIYGKNHKVTQALLFSLVPGNIDPTEELRKLLQYTKNYVTEIEYLGVSGFVNRDIGSRIFIGHGQSPIWRELKDFIDGRLSLSWDEFNREAVAGITTFDRISDMLESANFSFLIMTAEDQYSNETTHARQNVVHELGLFQGRLGPRKAIILLEHGCQEFSNIVGLSQIRFPKGDISAVFEEIRRVLEREKII